MKIELHHITVADLVTGYVDENEKGVRGYSGNLDIRPPYQREFVYTGDKQQAVITTILNSFPLNSIYWADRGDGTYEVIDGQQRIISICRYAAGKFSYSPDGKNPRFIHNLPTDIRQKFLDYKLTVYFCQGTDSEKLAWFKVINIAGEPLVHQELLNAVYHGPWLADAKGYFSRGNCAGYLLSKDYVSANVNRQGLLERAIDWVSDGHIEQYMAEHQNDPTALEIWDHFNRVINWVKATFKVTRSDLMKSVPWGPLYRIHGKDKLDPNAIEKEIEELLADDEIAKKGGIYEYILTRDKKYLNFRTFLEGDKRKAYNEQKGICPHCHKHFEYNQMEGDHVVPWSQGGKTEYSNLQMLCRECNRRKGNR